MDQVRQHPEEFVWTHIPSIAELGRRRMAAMRQFIADYPRGTAEGRYVEASLPELPFDDGAFDLALSSHLLFLYSEQLDLAFHIRALEEMLRVATEVRAFPLLQLGGTPSPHVESVVDVLRSRNADVTVEPVGYEFQRGGNRMLRLRRKLTASLSRTRKSDREEPPASARLRYYRSTDATITTSGTAVGTDAVPGLAASGPGTGGLDATAPSTTVQSTVRAWTR